MRVASSPKSYATSRISPRKAKTEGGGRRLGRRFATPLRRIYPVERANGQRTTSSINKVYCFRVFTISLATSAVFVGECARSLGTTVSDARRVRVSPCTRPRAQSSVYHRHGQLTSFPFLHLATTGTRRANVTDCTPARRATCVRVRRAAQLRCMSASNLSHLSFAIVVVRDSRTVQMQIKYLTHS